jgi:hypothetical protein
MLTKELYESGVKFNITLFKFSIVIFMSGNKSGFIWISFYSYNFKVLIFLNFSIMYLALILLLTST